MGDVVWLRNHLRHNTPNWIGPYAISSKTGPDSYHLFDPWGTVRAHPVNIADLKRAMFEPEQSERWYEQFI